MRRLMMLITAVIIMAVALNHSAVLAEFVYFQNANVGKEAVDFVLKTVGGGELSFKEISKGQKTIIFFWATWCPHCREALKDLNKRTKEFEEQGIRIVLVDVGESEEIVQNYITTHNINYDTFLDQASTLPQTYDLIGVPTFIFINNQGQITAVKHSLPDHYNTILEKTFDSQKGRES